MTKVIVFETEGTNIETFRRSPKGKSEKFIKHKEWDHDPKKLRKEAEKPQ